jgi:hypothetical protein
MPGRSAPDALDPVLIREHASITLRRAREPDFPKHGQALSRCRTDLGENRSARPVAPDRSEAETRQPLEVSGREVIETGLAFDRALRQYLQPVDFADPHVGL